MRLPSFNACENVPAAPLLEDARESTEATPPPENIELLDPAPPPENDPPGL
jgi:hypothetical protein